MINIYKLCSCVIQPSNSYCFLCPFFERTRHIEQACTEIESQTNLQPNLEVDNVSFIPNNGGSCSCKSGCSNNRCGCQKEGLKCGTTCRCRGCLNKFQYDVMVLKTLGSYIEQKQQLDYKDVYFEIKQLNYCKPTVEHFQGVKKNVAVKGFIRGGCGSGIKYVGAYSMELVIEPVIICGKFILAQPWKNKRELLYYGIIEMGYIDILAKYEQVLKEKRKKNIVKKKVDSLDNYFTGRTFKGDWANSELKSSELDEQLLAWLRNNL